MEQHAVVLTYLDAHKVYVFNSLEEARKGLKILSKRCLEWATNRAFCPDMTFLNDSFEIKGINLSIQGDIVHVSPIEQLKEREATKKDDMLSVVCISTRNGYFSNQIIKGSFYKIDPMSIWIDSDGDAWGTIYSNEGDRIGQLLLNHFSCV